MKITSLNIIERFFMAKEIIQEAIKDTVLQEPVTRWSTDTRYPQYYQLRPSKIVLDEDEVCIAEADTPRNLYVEVRETSSLISLVQSPKRLLVGETRSGRKILQGETLLFEDLSAEQNETGHRTFISAIDRLTNDDGLTITIPENQASYSLDIKPRINTFSHPDFERDIKEYKQSTEYLKFVLDKFYPTVSFSPKQLAFLLADSFVFVLDEHGPIEEYIGKAVKEDPRFPVNGEKWTGNPQHPVRINLTKPPYFFEILIEDPQNPNPEYKLVAGVRFSHVKPQEIHSKIKQSVKDRSIIKGRAYRAHIDPYVRAIDPREVEENFHHLK